jgi:hypothetical protein
MGHYGFPSHVSGKSMNVSCEAMTPSARVSNLTTPDCGTRNLRSPPRSRYSGHSRPGDAAGPVDMQEMTHHVGADPCNRFALGEAASGRDSLVRGEELRTKVLFGVGSHPLRRIVDEVPNLLWVGLDEDFSPPRHEHGCTLRSSQLNSLIETSTKALVKVSFFRSRPEGSRALRPARYTGPTGRPQNGESPEGTRRCTPG